MKKYLCYFKIPLVIFVLFQIAGISCKIISTKQGKKEFVRNNPECTTERVFDYGEVLTEEEEQKLREKIAQAESACGTDIVVVTLNEPLEEYINLYGMMSMEEFQSMIGEAGIGPYQYMELLADGFYDRHEFGYNRPHGDGVLLLDNWYRQSDGKIYSWMSTSGKAERKLGSEDIERILGLALSNVDDEPAAAYEYFAELVCDYLKPQGNVGQSMGGWISAMIGIAAGVIFFFVNYGGRKGRKTVETRTYVKNGKPVIRNRQDIFLNKTVTRRKIVTESNSHGGGGHHVSAGGKSHGGGGHSR